MPVRRGQAVDFLLPHTVGGVRHPERPQEVLGEVIVEGPRREPGEKDAEQSEGVVVAPPLPRLEREREPGEAREPFVGPEGERIASGFGPVLGHGALQR